MRIYYLLILYLLNSCAIGGSNLSSIDRAEEFFLCFPETDKGSMLLFTLDLKGIAASGGSACSSGSSKGSHVLQGINANPNRPNARFSFSRYTTLKEIDYTVEQVVDIFKNKVV